MRDNCTPRPRPLPTGWRLRLLRWVAANGDPDHNDLTYAMNLWLSFGFWSFRLTWWSWCQNSLKASIMRRFGVRWCWHCMQSEMSVKLVPTHNDAYPFLCLSCDEEEREYYEDMHRSYYGVL